MVSLCRYSLKASMRFRWEISEIMGFDLWLLLRLNCIVITRSTLEPQAMGFVGRDMA